jgi:hypothetical protein
MLLAPTMGSQVVSWPQLGPCVEDVSVVVAEALPLAVATIRLGSATCHVAGTAMWSMLSSPGLACGSLDSI